jgi:hypothetical protein
MHLVNIVLVSSLASNVSVRCPRSSVSYEHLVGPATCSSLSLSRVLTGVRKPAWTETVNLFRTDIHERLIGLLDTHGLGPPGGGQLNTVTTLRAGRPGFGSRQVCGAYPAAYPMGTGA